MRGDSTWACREPRSGSRGALGAGCLRPGAKTTGDLTRYFEFFASAVGDGMSDIARDLEGRQETEQRRPWMTVRPPDQLDRQIFDAVQRLGSATIQQLLGAVHEPPPLRTVQRRLKKLCDKGGDSGV
ncbi:MAG: Lrp/AsnC family transcriptional regulator [Polyangiaceae bacterium]